MSAAPSFRTGGARTLLHPVALCLAVMPFQWLSVAGSAEGKLKLPYLVILVLLLSVLINPRAIMGCVMVVRRTALILVPYGFYLLILILALYGSLGQMIPFRQVFFVAAFVALAGYLAILPRPGDLFRYGAGMSLFLFVVVIEVLARKSGLSWTTAIPYFLTTGDLDYVIYSFFRTVFNALNPDGETTVAAAAKNSLAVAVFVAGVLFRAGHAGPAQDRKGWAITLLALFFILMLNTRSVLLVALASLPLVSFLRLARGDAVSLAGVFAKSVLAITFASLVLLFLTSDSGLLDTLQRRFDFSDNSTGSRFQQYGWAMQNIEHNLLTGIGYAEIDGHPVHNLFLGAWMHAGIMAFLLVCVFYVGIIVAWLRFIAGLVRRPDHWILPVRSEWVAVLPMLPLFRVWLSGDAGHLFLGEWLALAAFFGALTANQVWRRMAEGSALPTRPAQPVRLTVRSSQ